MATIDVGSGHQRDVNRELPLIPFIDFLLCLVSFLLITAVWSRMARIEADARVPGIIEPGPTQPDPKQLHVVVSDRSFRLQWRQGSTILSSREVPRQAVAVGEDVRFPELERRLAEEWKANGLHQAPADRKLDRAVVHAPNGTPFSELVAVMDAVHTPKRELADAGLQDRVSAFSLSFAVD